MINKPYNSVVRIIGGIYKRTKLNVIDIQGLRPTPDRLRETLFNWLGDIYELRCLDMFAGSGVLGFECVSRQAKYALLLEKNKQVYQNLKEIQTKLKIDTQTIDIINRDSILYFNSIDKQLSNKFDIIFLDPPYAANLLNKALEISINILNPSGFIYVEDNKDLSKLILDHNLSIYRHIKMGQIYAYLLRPNFPIQNNKIYE